MMAASVVAATGTFGAPHIPVIEGASSFGGTGVHSAAYPRPTDFAGQRVIVVGAANSAVQIAAELAGHASVTLATREANRSPPPRPFVTAGTFLINRFGIE